MRRAYGIADCISAGVRPLSCLLPMQPTAGFALSCYAADQRLVCTKLAEELLAPARLGTYRMR